MSRAALVPMTSRRMRNGIVASVEVYVEWSRAKRRDVRIQGLDLCKDENAM